MKRVLLFTVLSATLGWVIGDMLRPTQADRIENAISHDMRMADRQHGTALRVHRKSEGTIELAANDSADRPNLPSEILDARALGAEARQKAFDEAVGKVFPKDGDWGMGGPLFPLGERFTAKPVPRPTQVASNTTFFDMVPDPSGVPVPPGGWLFGPGDPLTTPHITWVDVFGSNPPGPPPVNPPVTPPGEPPPVPIPEPAGWALMILGFALLAMRLRRIKYGATQV